MARSVSSSVLRVFRELASRIRRDRVFIVIGDALCDSDEMEVLMGRARCREFDEDLYQVYYEIRSIIAELNVECIASVCINGIARRILDKVIELYGSCETGVKEAIPKHVADEYLKCLSVCDVVVFLGLETPLSFVADSIPLGLALGKRVILISNSITELDGVHPLYERITY